MGVGRSWFEVHRIAEKCPARASLDGKLPAADVAAGVNDLQPDC
jgi:hypothetical protein